MDIDWGAVQALETDLPEDMLARIEAAAERIASAKRDGGQVAVVTGSGPNVHEGVTTLLAELMRLGIVDGVSTSSAVIAHEMGGTLDKVKRVDGTALGLEPALLPHGGHFELSVLKPETLAAIEAAMPVDHDLMARLEAMEGETIIKAAGNLGYPEGLYLEKLAVEVAALARAENTTFEKMAGYGADPRTMIGAGARNGLPVLVTIPQLVGGGTVGLAIGDSISITERAARLARMLDRADVIIESAVALTQEVHDGPFETYTGHGLWAGWQGHPTYSLEGKTLVRIDLDPALEAVWQAERGDGAVQEAINKGLPKTKLFKVPFRMEMSGFARLEGSVAVVGDIGAVWPVLAARVCRKLGVEPAFMSYPQQTEQGQRMREWIVNEVRPFNREKMLASLGA